MPLIFDSPHSGQVYPEDFDFHCSALDLRQSEDNFVDALFAHAPEHGAALLCAHFPRTYIDPNRAEDDIDPSLIEGVFPAPIAPSQRSDAGIGLIRRLIKPGVPVYDRKLQPQEVQARIEGFYRPYIAALEGLYEEAHYRFGQVYHINCHSMPAETAYPNQPLGFAGHKPKAADFCIGDRDGTTASRDFVHTLRDVLRAKGYTVTINDPFKGVELIQRFSDPARGRHAVQLEVNKALYMDENTLEKMVGFETVKSVLNTLMADISAYARAQMIPRAAD